MATKAPKITLLLILLIACPSQPTEGLLQFGQWRTLFSLSHSLMNRVSNLRASRGDFDGADRARRIAEMMEGGLGLGSWGVFLSMGWDYARNYEWRDFGSSEEMSGVVSDANEILDAVKELSRMESEKERVRWISQNYQRVLDPSRSLLRRLLLVIARSGPLQEMLLIVQKEAQGDIIRDCLEVGANDLQGLLQIAKDIALNFLSSPSSRSHPSDDL